MIRIYLKKVVTLHMKSKAKLRFVCREVEIAKAGNDLHTLTTRGGALPFYVRLDEIEAISYRSSWTRFWWSFA